jgi:hypothetical protein
VFTDPGATAYDTFAGNLTGQIIVGGDTVDTNTPSIYTITYNVSDPVGNVAVEAVRTVIVLNNCGEGGGEGEGEGEGEGSAPTIHSADKDGNGVISLGELLRVIQYFNIGSLHCDVLGEDGFNPGPGDQTCTPHSSDYNPQNWSIELLELLRIIQFFNLFGYYPCPGLGEDGFCPGTV